MEVWKDVIGYEGYYQISNYGLVKSLDRVVDKNIGQKKLLKSRLLKQGIDKDGYKHVILYKNGRGSIFKTHKLVAIAFIDNPNNKKEINHKNGVKTDNKIENLEWCTRSENVKHAFKNGLKKPIFGETHVSSKLSEEQAIKIKYGHKDLTQYQIADLYNINQANISDIRLGKTWKHI